MLPAMSEDGLVSAVEAVEAWRGSVGEAGNVPEAAVLWVLLKAHAVELDSGSDKLDRISGEIRRVVEQLSLLLDRLGAADSPLADVLELLKADGRG